MFAQVISIPKIKKKQRGERCPTYEKSEIRSTRREISDRYWVTKDYPEYTTIYNL